MDEHGSFLTKQEWNDDLASLAQMWSNQCVWGHGFVSFGENYPKTVPFKGQVGKKVHKRYKPLHVKLQLNLCQNPLLALYLELPGSFRQYCLLVKFRIIQLFKVNYIIDLRKMGATNCHVVPGFNVIDCRIISL